MCYFFAKAIKKSTITIFYNFVNSYQFYLTVNSSRVSPMRESYDSLDI